MKLQRQERRFNSERRWQIDRRKEPRFGNICERRKCPERRKQDNLSITQGSGGLR